MAEYFRHRVYCNGCAEWHELNTFTSSEPTCPINSGHALDASKTTVVETMSSCTPLDDRGRVIVMPTLRDDPHTWAYFSSAGDHATNGIGEGDELVASLTTQESVTKSISYIEDVEVQSGGMSVQNATLTDRFSLWVHAPLTPTTTWSSGIKLAKVPVGTSMNVLIPSAEGTFQFDESNGQIPIPVEAYDVDWNPTGYWDRVIVDGDYSSAAYTFNSSGTGQFNFYDFAIDLGWFVNNVRVIAGSDGRCVPFANDDPFNCFKGWQIKFMVENGNTSRTDALNAAVVLRLNRKTIR